MAEFENVATLCAVVVAITLAGTGSGAALATSLHARLGGGFGVDGLEGVGDIGAHKEVRVYE